MPVNNSPYSGSVIILSENQDGIELEVYHWTDLPDGTPVPPRGPLGGLLNGGQFMAQAGVTIPVTFHKKRMAATQADLVSKFAAYIAAKFPETAP